MDLSFRSRPGRGCQEETSELVAGLDFRLPKYRREVFLRFYEFHIKYRSHPGCVYFVMPELAHDHSWGLEEKLWFAFLNGNTQNPVTSWLIMREFPTVLSAQDEILTRWFDDHWGKLQFDTDRRHHKRIFPVAVQKYRQLTGGDQQGYFASLCEGSESRNFEVCWKAKDQFYGFGRLSMFSYLEYLRIMGLPIRCNNLFLSDLEGSKSHRNGLCKVLGRDDLDWHDSNPDFPGYSKEVLAWLDSEAEALLVEATNRLAGAECSRDVGYFTLESALCTYKGWHRLNRRYPNVYCDLLHDRIRWAEEKWGESLTGFWDIRQRCLPDYLRLEATPRDPGVCPRKQNHYRDTGEPIMMHRDWACFENGFNREVEG